MCMNFLEDVGYKDDSEEEFLRCVIKKLAEIVVVHIAFDMVIIIGCVLLMKGFYVGNQSETEEEYRSITCSLYLK